MTATTDDLRIQKTNELISPEQLIADIGVSDAAAQTVANARSLPLQKDQPTALHQNIQHGT